MILLGRPTAEFLAGRSLHSAATLLLTVVVVTLVTAILILTLGEIVPRVVLRRLSSHAVFAVAIPLRIADILLFPFIWFAWSASVRTARSLGATDDGILDAINADLVDAIDENAAGFYRHHGFANTEEGSTERAFYFFQELPDDARPTG